MSDKPSACSTPWDQEALDRASWELQRHFGREGSIYGIKACEEIARIAIVAYGSALPSETLCATNAAPQGNKASSAPSGADLSAADSEPVAGTPPIPASRGLPNNPAGAASDDKKDECCESFETCTRDCIPRLHWHDDRRAPQSAVARSTPSVGERAVSFHEWWDALPDESFVGPSHVIKDHAWKAWNAALDAHAVVPSATAPLAQKLNELDARRYRWLRKRPWIHRGFGITEHATDVEQALGVDANIDMFLNAADRTIQPEMVECESCIGSGKIREEGETPKQDTWRRCMDCSGTGEVPRRSSSTSER